MNKTITVIDKDDINPSYRVETTLEHKPGFDEVLTCNVIKINGTAVDTKGLSITKGREFIEIVKESETHINIKTSNPSTNADPEKTSTTA